MKGELNRQDAEDAEDAKVLADDHYQKMDSQAFPSIPNTLKKFIFQPQIPQWRDRSTQMGTGKVSREGCEDFGGSSQIYAVEFPAKSGQIRPLFYLARNTLNMRKGQ